MKSDSENVRRRLSESVKMRIAVHGSTYLKNGADYLKADRVEIALKIINMKMHLDNLFNGDKVLGDLGNSLINQNQHLFLKDFEPNLQTSLGKRNFQIYCEAQSSIKLSCRKTLLESCQPNLRESSIRCLPTLRKFRAFT